MVFLDIFILQNLLLMKIDLLLSDYICVFGVKQCMQFFVLMKVMEELVGCDIEYYDYIFINFGCFKF